MTEADRQLARFDRTAIFVREFVLPSHGQVTVYERKHAHFSVWPSDTADYFHIMAVSDGPDGTARVDYYRRPIHGDFVPVVLRVMGCAENGDLKLIDGVSVHPLNQLRREWLAEDGKQDGCA